MVDWASVGLRGIWSLGILSAIALTGCGSLGAMPQGPPSSTQSPYSGLPSRMVPESPSTNVTGSSSASAELAAIADQLCVMGCADGLSGIVVDEASRTLTVWWKGEMPADVKAFVQRERPGLTVESIEGAKWDRSEMQTAAERVNHDVDSFKRLGIVSVSANADGSGITVNISGGTLDIDDVKVLERISGMSGGVKVVAGRGPAVPQ